MPGTGRVLRTGKSGVGASLREGRLRPTASAGGWAVAWRESTGNSRFLLAGHLGSSQGEMNGGADGRTLPVSCPRFCACAATASTFGATRAASGPHIHVSSGDRTTKVWLGTLELAQTSGYDSTE